MTKEYKLDIFDALSAIDRRDGAFLEKQDEVAQKGFVPRVVLRWTSAVQGRNAEHYMWCANEIANVQFDDLYEYPDLQFRLLAMCGTGTRQKHDWIAMPKRGKTTPKINAFMAQFYPLANTTEIDLLVSKFNSDSFADFVHSSGCSPEEAKGLIDAYKKAGEPETKAKGRKPKA